MVGKSEPLWVVVGRESFSRTYVGNWKKVQLRGGKGGNGFSFSVFGFLRAGRQAGRHLVARQREKW